MEEDMIKENEMNCPNCGKNLKRHDCVKRHYRTKGGVRKYILVERMKCIDCRKIHRVIPDFLCAYKHYEKEIISGVLEGLITSDTIAVRLNSEQIIRKKSKIILLPKQSHEKHVL